MDEFPTTEAPLTGMVLWINAGLEVDICLRFMNLSWIRCLIWRGHGVSHEVFTEVRGTSDAVSARSNYGGRSPLIVP